MRQHPLEFIRPGDRFAVMIEVKKYGGETFFEPLAYGLRGQPSPEMLLRRGSRATTWATEDEARAAVKDSLLAWEAAGCKWHHHKQMRILKLEVAS